MTKKKLKSALVKNLKENTRQIMYKRVKAVLPCCPVCKERLLGNNSIVSPYFCKCGVWKHNFFNDDPFTYNLVKK